MGRAMRGGVGSGDDETGEKAGLATMYIFSFILHKYTHPNGFVKHFYSRPDFYQGEQASKPRLRETPNFVNPLNQKESRDV